MMFNFVKMRISFEEPLVRVIILLKPAERAFLAKMITCNNLVVTPGLASTVFIMQSATNHFAKQIAWKYDATFFISLLSFAIVMRCVSPPRAPRAVQA